MSTDEHEFAGLVKVVTPQFTSQFGGGIVEKTLTKFNELSEALLSFMRKAKEAMLRHDPAGGQRAYESTEEGVSQFRALLKDATKRQHP